MPQGRGAGCKTFDDGIRLSTTLLFYRALELLLIKAGSNHEQGRSALDHTADAIQAPFALPSRLHHAAYVSADPELTRRFYEDMIGLPLIACWVEREDLAGELHEFSHAFYGLADGGALAFFNFADPELRARYIPARQSFFVHLALQTERAARDALRQRLQEAAIPFHEIDHGFTHSLYVVDPDGQQIEFCVDTDDYDSIMRHQKLHARSAIKRWCDGDRTPTNDLRK